MRLKVGTNVWCIKPMDGYLTKNGFYPVMDIQFEAKRIVTVDDNNKECWANWDRFTDINPNPSFMALSEIRENIDRELEKNGHQVHWAVTQCKRVLVDYDALVGAVNIADTNRNVIAKATLDLLQDLEIDLKYNNEFDRSKLNRITQIIRLNGGESYFDQKARLEKS